MSRRRPPTILPCVLYALALLACGDQAPPAPTPAPAPVPDTKAPSPADAPPAAAIPDVAPFDAPRLALTLEDEHFRALIERRNEALERGLLIRQRGDYVPAQLTHDGKTVTVKMRLKGDWVDHLTGKKLSFRVKVRNDDAVLRMRVFSLQHPRTRLYTNEWQFLEHLRAEDVLAPRYEFVHLTVNGDDWGLYALEEHFSKELLESQQRREGVILKYDEGDFWDRTAVQPMSKAWGLIPDHFEHQPTEVFRRKKTRRSPQLAGDRDAAFALLEGFSTGERKASEVFDVRTLARFLAISELWSTNHGLRWHNLRLYYDPLAARLEPIGFDAEPAEPRPSFVTVAEPWSRQALSDPVVGAAFVRELRRMGQRDYLIGVQERQKDGLLARMALLRQEFPDMQSFGFSAIDRKAELVREMLALGATVRAVAWPAAGDDGELVLQLINRASLPVEVVGHRPRRKGEEAAPITPFGDGPIVLAPRARDARPPAARVTIPRPPGERVRLEVLARFAGLEEARAVEVQLLGAAPGHRALAEPPTRAQALAAHAFLQAAEQGALRIGAGTHAVKGDLVLPADTALTIEAGVELRFEPGAVLLSSGPLHLRGTPEAPVHLTARGESFAGVFVSEAGARSDWTHARVSRTASIERPGFRATGGVTFYRSPLSLSHCRFEDSLGEDALNVVRASIEMRDTHFARAASDAFDGDWVKGTLREVSFEEIGGDGTDVSGSELDVRGLRASKIGDKALSAGEESRVTVRDLVVDHARFAVASKDLSHVSVESAVVRDTRVGWAAYRKKHEFGPAHIEARKVTMERVEAGSLCELDSGVELDGAQTTCKEFAVRPFVDSAAATPPPKR